MCSIVWVNIRYRRTRVNEFDINKSLLCNNRKYGVEGRLVEWRSGARERGRESERKEINGGK